MTSINLLTAGIDNLWYWTYSIIVGWGASFTIIVAIIILLAIRVLHCEQRLRQIESRVVTAEREVNLALTRFESK
jgi:hypothetical protein